MSGAGRAPTRTDRHRGDRRGDDRGSHRVESFDRRGCSPKPRCTKRRPRRRVTVESPGGKRWPTAAPGLCPPPARDRTQRRDYATAGPARTGIPAAERHIIPQLSHVEQINCYVASDMASQPNSLSENVRRLCRRGDWRTEQRWRLSCRHRSGVSRFGATGQKPVDGWTAATRLTASPEARQQQPKRSTHLVRKPVSSKCSRHAWPCHS